MRLCRFAGGYGLLQGDDVVDITQHVPAIGDVIGDPLVHALPRLLALNAKDLAKASRRRTADVQLLSPIRSPTKILAAPNNYREHTAEMQHVDPNAGARMANMEEAGFFLKATSSLVGPSEGILQRFPERRTDHEVELVVVIGEVISRPVEVAEAAVSSPDTVSASTSPCAAPKSAACANRSTPIRSSGQRLSHQSTLLSDMVFNVEEQIAYASRFYTLYPGDLIYTGTPSGVGPIRPSDIIYADISNLGEIEVHVR